MQNQTNPSLSYEAATATLHCHGNWTLPYVAMLSQQFHSLTFPAEASLQLNGQAITALDSAGAYLIKTLRRQLEQAQHAVSLIGFSEARQQLLTLIEQYSAEITPQDHVHKAPNLFYRIGKVAMEKCREGLMLLNFTGELSYRIVESIKKPRQAVWRSTVNVIEIAGHNAIPIIALLQFLVGIVLAYQMGIQLRTYGANIYIVQFSGMAILREFGPLITAIIVAGRTGSAFTAKLGMMKVQEEVDALRTMGLSPTTWLVIPNLLGLMVALPLLTVLADVSGMLGAMVMSKRLLDIGYLDFFNHIQTDVKFGHYSIGLVKAPLFAAIISLVGCFQGFQVRYSAVSVGSQTTRGVVQAIFLVIIVDAIFSMLFSWTDV